MLQRRYFYIIILLLVLLLIRTFEGTIFYDPLQWYFKNDYLQKDLPMMNQWLLALSYTARFMLNSIVAIGVLKWLFPKRKYWQQSIPIYIALYLVLMLVFMVVINFKDQSNYLTIFYVRRFLIQPILLLLLLVYYLLEEKQKLDS